MGGTIYILIQIAIAIYCVYLFETLWMKWEAKNADKEKRNPSPRRSNKTQNKGDEPNDLY